MNIAFYVSGNATRLCKIIEQNHEDVLSCTKFVFSDDDRTTKLKGLINNQDNIDYFCLNHSDISPTEKDSKNKIMSDRLLGLLVERNIDYCFSFGDHLLVGDILKEYENKIINFHPSILPLFPGRKSIDQALDSESNLLGNTAHFINEGVDTGPIIMQQVQASHSFNGDYSSVLDNQIVMLKQIINWLSKGRLKVVNGKVLIAGADYSTIAFFPAVEG